MFDLIKREPALTMGVVQAVLTVLTVFGLPLTPAQIAAVLALSAALLSWITRSMVTPVAKNAK